MGVAPSGWLTAHFGWTGIAAFGIAVAMAAASLHFLADRQYAASTIRMMNTHLNLNQNLDDFEAFYDLLDGSHADLGPTGREIFNSQLLLLLANHIGDMAVLREAFALARVKLEMIDSQR